MERLGLWVITLNNDQGIISRLDLITKLIALKVLEGKDLKEQVRILSSIGMSPKQIADITGEKPVTVRVVLHRMRKRTGSDVQEEVTSEGQT